MSCPFKYFIHIGPVNLPQTENFLMKKTNNCFVLMENATLFPFFLRKILDYLKAKTKIDYEIHIIEKIGHNGFFFLLSDSDKHVRSGAGEGLHLPTCHIADFFFYSTQNSMVGYILRYICEPCIYLLIQNSRECANQTIFIFIFNSSMIWTFKEDHLEFISNMDLVLFQISPFLLEMFFYRRYPQYFK